MAKRHSISLSNANDVFALEKAKEMFDSKISTYINYLINKEREKELKKMKEIEQISKK